MDSKDLANAIRNNARIILPNFGAFLLKDTGDNAFKPENITFSPFLKYNDNILEEFIAKQQGINKDEAIKQTKILIDSIKETLNSTEFYVIEGIGKLSRNSRGAIIFTAEGIAAESTEVKAAAPKTKKTTKKQKNDNSETEKPLETESNNVNESDITITPAEELEHHRLDQDTNYNSTSSQLAKPLQNNIAIEDDKECLEAETKETFEIIQTQSTTETEIATHMPSTKVKSPIKAILIYLAVSLAIIIALAFILREFAFNNENEGIYTPKPEITEEVTAKPNAGEREPSKPKDEIDKAFDEMQSGESSSNSKAEEEQPRAEEEIEKSIIENASIKNQAKEQFHLVVGSFKDKSNAEKYAKQLNSEGYNSTVIVQPNGNSVVTAGSYPTKEMANAEKIKLAKKFSSIWIVKK